MLFQPLGSGAEGPRAVGWDHGHALVATVLEMLLVPRHLLKSIPSHLHHQPTKGRASHKIPGSVLRLFESFPAMFIRSSLCTLPARTKQRCYGNCKHQAILPCTWQPGLGRDNGFCCYLLGEDAQSLVPSGPNQEVLTAPSALSVNCPASRRRR